MKKRALLLLIIFMVTICLAKTYRADNFQCMISVQENGDLQIREVFTYYFSGDTFSWVKREVPERKTDGIELLSMSLREADGKLISEVEDYRYKSGELRAKWEFEPVVDKALSFELNYLVSKVCYLNSDRLELFWKPIPTEREFIIKKGKVDVIFPKILPPDLEILATGSDKIKVSKYRNTLTYTFGDLDPEEKFKVHLSLPVDFMAVEQPRWQIIAEQQHYYGRYLKLLGLITGTMLLLLIIFLVYQSMKISKLYKLTEVPGDLLQKHPVMTGYFMNGLSSGAVSFAAIFFRLLKSKSVSINKTGKKKYEFTTHEIEPEDEIDRRFFEILVEKEAEGKNNVKKLFNSLEKYKKEFDKMIKNWFFDEGFALEDRYKLAKNYLITILLIIFVTFFVFIFGLILFDSGNPFLLFAIFPLIWLSFGLIYRAGKIEVFTPEGYGEKYAWKLWKKNMLYQMKHSPENVKAEEFDLIFPFAMVMGFGEQYQKFFQKAGIDLSDSKLVQSFESMDEFVVFVGWYASVAASTGASGAGSAGGGAGGGSASAG